MSALLAEYRCRARGCLLLRVWQSPDGPQWSKPRRRLSPLYALLRDFHDAGVLGAAMPASGGRLDDCAGHVTIPVGCAHTRDRLRVADIRRDIDKRTPGRPARIPMGADTPTHHDPQPGIW